MARPLDEAKSNYMRAKAEYNDSIKAALRVALGTAFQNPEINTVAWGVCTRPYNDEGAYPGMFGPVANLGADADDPGGFAIDRDEEIDLFYDQTTETLDDAGVKAVEDIIEAVDLDDFADAFGISRADDYGEQVAYVAYRTDIGGATYKIERIEIDY